MHSGFLEEGIYIWHRLLFLFKKILASFERLVCFQATEGDKEFLVDVRISKCNRDVELEEKPKVILEF